LDSCAVTGAAAAAAALASPHKRAYVRLLGVRA
jgi:hypothetical protein